MDSFVSLHQIGLILNFLGAILIAAELIGSDRLEALEKRTDRLTRELANPIRLFSPVFHLVWESIEDYFSGAGSAGGHPNPGTR